MDESAGEVATRFAAAQTDRLRVAARRHGVPLNTLLQGAWAVVLSRYTGEDDVVFGAVRACRHVPVEGAAGIVGPMVNTVALRVRLASDASVDHWLRGLREQWIALRDFEHTPLMQVQQWAGVAGGRPLFDTLFSYQEPSWIAALRRLPGAWDARAFELRSQPGYPLALEIFADDALLIRAVYDRRRFSAEAMARLLGHFRAAIERLSDLRADRLGEITVLEPHEQEQLLEGFNQTAAPFPRDECIHALFEARVRSGPERPAVKGALSTLTYDELNRRANQLAHRLRKLGVGPEVPVAVGMRRSPEMIIAWLGALKAGGAFVPLDVEAPLDRLVFQIRDCGAPVLLTDPGFLPAALMPGQPPRVEVALAAWAFGDEPDANPAGVTTAGNLAYVVYTSGSTGQPKGVEIEHHSLVNLATWHQRTYAVAPDDRASQIANPAFDAAGWEIWPYLAAGACVCVPDEATRLSPAALWRWVAMKEITIAFFPTPVAEAALAELWPDRMTLRVLLTGGDRLKRPAPIGFPCALVNHYGPTENTVVATAAAVVSGGCDVPPIGRPIANTTAYVLDRELRPVPIGVPGELYLAGEGLARGYRDRPILTAERFLRAEFTGTRFWARPAPEGGSGTPAHGASAEVAGRRLYRTGDLVRWRADGQLEFLGRTDSQVKIRGCRVELGEIEAVLQQHPRVREAVVLAREDPAGSTLTAYVIGAPGAAPTELQVLEHLRARLPGYMIPATITLLDSWPLTPNGKINRRALPSPEIRKERWSDGLAPRITAEEQAVASIWSGVLGVDAVHPHDDFFALGGHSLLAAQATTRVSTALGRRISVRLLFDHPVLGDFVREAMQRPAAGGRAMPLLRASRGAPAEVELANPR